MNNQDFDYSQKLKPRIINDSRYQRFIWENFNFGTTYNEPFGQISLKDSSSQPYVFSQTVKPVRSIELEMSVLHFDDVHKPTCPEWLSYNKLQDFYFHHGCHSTFIFPHPVYGDMLVRFAKPIMLPRKNIGGSGTVQGFSITLAEVIDTDYFFARNENMAGDMPLHAGYYDVEIEYTEDTLVAPLGSNYQMVFKKTKKPLRTLKLNLNGLIYLFNREDGSLNISHCPEQNMALLEIFYLKHRLTETFLFNYMGEDIPVRFQSPLNIPKVATNNGLIGELEITLIETPFETLEKEDLNAAN